MLYDSPVFRKWTDPHGKHTARWSTGWKKYDFFKELLDAHPRKIKRKKILRYTHCLLNPDKSISITHHNTEVIKYTPDGKVFLYDGGWRSFSSKCRINWFSPAGVFAYKNTWYVSVERTGWRMKDLRFSCLPFYNGIEISNLMEIPTYTTIHLSETSVYDMGRPTMSLCGVRDTQRKRWADLEDERFDWDKVPENYYHYAAPREELMETHRAGTLCCLECHTIWKDARVLMAIAGK